MKQAIKRILSVLTVFSILFTLVAPAWAAGNQIKCYTISAANTKVYKDAALSEEYGTIYPTDELEVLVVSSKYARVKYPIRNGTKTGYIPRSAIILKTSGKDYYAKENIVTYRRASTANSYGEIYANDRVRVLGTRGSFTQVRYPVSWGYKYAFIKTTDANRAIYGKKENNDDGDSISVSEGTYSFQSALNNNYVMDVSNNDSANGTNIQLWKSNNTDAQKYEVVSVGSGWYKIIHTASGKVLDVTNGEKGNNVNVEIWSYNGGDNQKWRFQNAGNGYFYIQSKLGYYLDVDHGTVANGTNILTYQLNKSINQKWKLVEENQTGDWRWPVNNYSVSQSFGHYSPSMEKKGRAYHSGVDLISSKRTIYAAADGIVTYRGYTSGNGNHVIIQHVVGNDTVYTLYSHLANYTGCPKVKQHVSCGDKIGTMGNTGNSTGTHLHFAVFTGSSNDPYGYTNVNSSTKMSYKGCTFYNPAMVISKGKLF